jgi:hypothetical protein
MVLASVLLVGTSATADEASVPVELQLQLLDRVVRYERGWSSRTDAVRVLVLRRAGFAESERVSAQALQWLARTGRLGGRAVTPIDHAYEGATPLGAHCEREGVSLVYVTPGLGAEVAAIARVLAARSILAVAAVGADVDRGAMVGFELAGARPRIAVHLPSLRAANLRFDPQFLRLARVIE